MTSSQRPPDLLVAVANLTPGLPQTPEDDPFRFLPEMLTAIPRELVTDKLIIKRGYHDYESWRIDYPQVFAAKNVYEALGVIALATVLGPDKTSFTLHVENVRSDIRRIEIESPYPGTDSPGLHQRATSFLYYADEVDRHPWYGELVAEPYDFPHFRLTNAADFLRTDAEWATRDVLHGFGSVAGTSRLAELFLDMSRAGNPVTEFPLECEAGYRGVAPASAEIRFWLPGGDTPDFEFPLDNKSGS